MAYFETFQPPPDHNESIKGAPGRFEAPRYINKLAEPPGGLRGDLLASRADLVFRSNFNKIFFAAESRVQMHH